MLEKAGARLFKRLRNPAYCLYSILPGNNKPYQLFLGKKGIYLPFHTALITCIKSYLSSVVFLSLYKPSCVCFVFHIMCCASVIPVLMHCSRLMSNKLIINIYLLTWLLRAFDPVCESVSGWLVNQMTFEFREIFRISRSWELGQQVMSKNLEMILNHYESEMLD